ncbi:MAG: hypothetical protein ACFFD6_09795, partial [Candidatus Thorarchaeota archaeon]
MKFRTERIMPPPILKLIEAAQRYVSSSEFLNLGQGLPGHIPPTDALKALGDTLLHPATHRYTPDQGHIELREELALQRTLHLLPPLWRFHSLDLPEHSSSGEDRVLVPLLI